MILFRADGNSEIGSGHIMRCLSIADALRDRGAECGFVMAGAEFEESVHKAGFKTWVLGTDYRYMEAELPLFMRIIDEAHAECVVVDSYYVTEAYFRAFPGMLRKVYIDDLTTAPYPVDMVVNYNLGAEEGEYRVLYQRVGSDCPTILAGTRFVPLRKEFQGHPLREPQEKMEQILVMTGGADHEHVALRYLRHLVRTENMGNYYFHFVLGAMNLDAGEIALLSAGQKNITLHRNVSRMHELMSQCDAAITASGSTMYELCASGVPIISYVLADNQMKIAAAFRDMGASVYAGDIRDNDNFPEIFDRLLEQIARDSEKRRTMTRTAYGLVDGNGVARIAEEMLT